MPGLDRIVTVGIEAEGRRPEHGDYISGEITYYRVWAQQQDGGSRSILGEDGFTLVRLRRYLMRYRKDMNLELIRPDMLTITDELGLIWYAENLDVSDGRSRYVTLAVVLDNN